MKTTFAIPLVFLLLSPALGTAGEILTQVRQSQLGEHWVPDQSRMASNMPPLAQSAFGLIRKHNRIVLDYEVTINAKGVPVNYRFVSINPASVDPRPFEAMIKFYRYSPSKSNPKHIPVRVHGPIPFSMPKPRS